MALPGRALEIRLIPKWVALLVVGIATLALSWWAGTGPADQSTTNAEAPGALPPGEIARPYTLHYKFDRTVFYSDHGRHYRELRDYVEKWERPIVVVVVGAASDYWVEFIHGHFEELTRLTGLEITLMKGVGSTGAALVSWARGDANFLIAIDRRSGIEGLLLDTGAPDEHRNLNRTAACFAFAGSDAGRIVAAFAAIPSEHREGRIRHCIIEETTQALGLYADSEIIQPSMFSVHNPALSELPLNDKIIVRTLYDPRITPGMPRDEALAVAQDVIAELVEAVRREGVEALYQRPGSPADRSVREGR